MGTFKFRVTQELIAFYEGEVEIDAKNEHEAKKKIDAMTTEQLDEIATNWKQNTDNAEANGEIEIQELV